MEKYVGQEAEMYDKVCRKYVFCLDEQQWRPLIIEMYKCFNPVKLTELDRVLDKYRGSEPALYRALCDKYLQALTKDGPVLNINVWEREDEALRGEAQTVKKKRRRAIASSGSDAVEASEAVSAEDPALYNRSYLRQNEAILDQTPEAEAHPKTRTKTMFEFAAETVPVSSQSPVRPKTMLEQEAEKKVLEQPVAETRARTLLELAAEKFDAEKIPAPRHASPFEAGPPMIPFRSPQRAVVNLVSHREAEMRARALSAFGKTS